MLYVDARPGETEKVGPTSFGPVRTHWIAIVVIALAFALGAFAWSMFQPKVYAATSSAIAVPQGQEDLSNAQAGEELAKSKVAGYESLARSKPVAQRVIGDLNLSAAPQNLVGDISADSPERTAEIHITAEADTPEAAAALADAWVASLAVQAAELQAENTVVGNNTPMITLQPLSSATVPEEPISPRIAVNTLLGALVGLVVGIAYAFARDRRARSRDSVVASTDSRGTQPVGEVRRRSTSTSTGTSSPDGVTSVEPSGW